MEYIAIVSGFLAFFHLHRVTASSDRQTGRQTDRETDRQTDRQGDRQRVPNSFQKFRQVTRGKENPVLLAHTPELKQPPGKHRLVTIEETTTNQTAALNSSCTHFGLFSPEHLSNGRLAHDAGPVRVVHVEHGLQLVLTGP